MSASLPVGSAGPARWNITITQRNKLHKIFYLYVPLTFFMCFALFPFVWMGISSFMPDEYMYDADIPPWAFDELTLEHYVDLLFETEFLYWVWNSLFIGITATAISVTFGALAGYSLARLRFPGASSLGMGIIVTYLVPVSVLFLPLAYVFFKWGLGDSRLALILAYPTHLIPFSTWFMLVYFKNIPAALEESAMIDGCTRLQSLWHVTLPLALPGVLAASIFSFTFSWNEFIYALTFISDDELKTIPVGVHGLTVVGDVYFWGRLMAASLMGSLPIAIIYAFLSEYFVKGLSEGALKQ
ncbi:MAG: carbohydrate ABC transporter permease [Nitrospinaceae bacterium]|nr:carbohydrate ABC transporter permease [Nitrospinaceae bacterium]